jgi:hypothetical protein
MKFNYENSNVNRIRKELFIINISEEWKIRYILK